MRKKCGCRFAPTGDDQQLEKRLCYNVIQIHATKPLFVLAEDTGSWIEKLKYVENSLKRFS